MNKKVLLVFGGLFWLVLLSMVAAQCAGQPDKTDPIYLPPSISTSVPTCRTFTAAGLPLDVPDDNITGTLSTIPIAMSGNITALTVTFTISHTFPGDLNIDLCKPNGNCNIVNADSSYYLRASASGRSISWSDDAPTLYGFPYTTDYWKPFSPFNVFGMKAAGSWALRVADYYATETGSLEAWSMTMCTIPEHITATPTSPPSYLWTPTRKATPFIVRYAYDGSPTPNCAAPTPADILPWGSTDHYDVYQCGTIAHTTETPCPPQNANQWYYCNTDPYYKYAVSPNLHMTCSNCGVSASEAAGTYWWTLNGGGAPIPTAPWNGSLKPGGYGAGVGTLCNDWSVYGTPVPTPDVILDYSYPYDVSSWPTPFVLFGNTKRYAGYEFAWGGTNYLLTPVPECYNNTGTIDFSATYVDSPWPTVTPVPTATPRVPCPTPAPRRPWWWIW